MFGSTRLYGHVPGAQAEFLRVPHGDFGPIKVPAEGPDEQYLYLSDVLPTAWQAAVYADIPEGGSVTVFRAGPIGQMSARIAKHKGARVIGVDPVRERREMARRHGIEVMEDWKGDGVPEAMPLVTDGADPLGVRDLATHRLPPSDAPDAYAMFQEKTDGAIKVVCEQ